MVVRIIKPTMETIHLLTDANSIQITVDVIINRVMMIFPRKYTDPDVTKVVTDILTKECPSSTFLRNVDLESTPRRNSIDLHLLWMLMYKILSYWLCYFGWYHLINMWCNDTGGTKLMKSCAVCSFCYVILRSCGVRILLCYFENYIIIIIVFSCVFG